MKGLLFREFYLGRKYYLLSFAMYLLIAVMSILVNLSMICGNLSRLSEDSIFQINENASTILKILPCIVIFLSFCTDGGVLFSDYKTSWIKYCCTTPILEKQLVKVKFTAKIISLAAALILSIAYLLILEGITGNDFPFSTFKNIVILFSFSVIVSSIFLMLSIRYKDKNAVAIRLIGIFAVLYIPTMAYMVKMMNQAQGDDDIFQNIIIEGFEKIRNILFPISPLLMIAAVAACYIFSVRFMKRREN